MKNIFYIFHTGSTFLKNHQATHSSLPKSYFNIKKYNIPNKNSQCQQDF